MTLNELAEILYTLNITDFGIIMGAHQSYDEVSEHYFKKAVEELDKYGDMNLYPCLRPHVIANALSRQYVGCDFYMV